MPRSVRVSRLAQVPGIGVDRTGNAADAAHDPEILRLENLDTDIPPPKIAIETTKNGIDADENNSYLPSFRKLFRKKLYTDWLSNGTKN